ncbi:MAG: C1 family peptidase, partial [Bacteroidales bacterium]
MKKIYLIALLLLGICGYGQTPAFKNTAMEYCKGLGYKIIEDPLSKQELCVLPNGEKVNPWDFLHGDVGKEYSYCAKKGYNLRIKEVKKGRTVNRYPICDAKGKPSKTLLAMLYEDSDFSSLYENSIYSPLPDTLPQPVSETIVSPPVIDPPGTDAITPPTFDWNSADGHDWDRTPENQGSYGICYAMAASSVAETVWNYQNNLPVDQGNSKNFSEAFIAFFGSFTYWGNPYEWFSMLGTKGLRSWYNEYVEDPVEKLCTNGIIEESEFPWDPDAPDTTYTYSPCERYRFTRFEKCPTTASAMKARIFAFGPLWTTMVYDLDLHQHYSGWVIYGNEGDCGEDLGQRHAVVIVGWNYTEQDGEYWIVKNSYGSLWGGGGANGYLKVSTDNALGINCNAYYLDYLPVQINGGDLAYNQQAITNIPSGHRFINYKPEPYSSFNGYASENVWSHGSTANLDPKHINGLDAKIKYKVVYGLPNGYRVDPDTIEYYEKNIWAGKPKTPTIDGPSNISCYVSYWYEGDATSNNGLNTAESFSWSHSNYIQVLATEDNPPRIRIQVGNPGYHNLTLTATNNCGSTVSQTFYIYCPECPHFMAVVYPNP